MKRCTLMQNNEDFCTCHSGQSFAGACINHYRDLGGGTQTGCQEKGYQTKGIVERKKGSYKSSKIESKNVKQM